MRYVNSIFTLFLFVLSCFVLPAQDMNVEWVAQIGGNHEVKTLSIVETPSGEIYTTGFFKETVDFDPGANTLVLSSAGKKDIFIQKLNEDGELLWVRQIGSTYSELSTSMAIDTQGNIYVAGMFSYTLDFDPGPSSYELTANGGLDIFILKLDSFGNFLWVHQIGGIYFDYCYSIDIDNAGNLHLAGGFDGIADFDPGPSEHLLISAGSTDAFVLKLDSSGNFLWVKQMGGPAYDACTEIKIGKDGNIYTSGLFWNVADFDPGPNTSTLYSSGSADIFVQKLDSLGNFLWARRMGGEGFDGTYGMAVDPWGSVCLTGVFFDVADFDPGENSFFLTPVGNGDAHITKLDSDGNFLWVKQIGGEWNDYGYSISADAAGNIYATGFFSEEAVFGNEILVSQGWTDVFIMKFNPAGEVVWYNQIGGISNDAGDFILAGKQGALYLSGTFSGIVDFDPGPDSTILDTDDLSPDIFIQKFRQCAPTYGMMSIAVCDSYTSPSGLHTWTQSGTYVDVIPNSSACDSIITINLTIETVDTSITQVGVNLIANASGAIYQWLDCENGYSALAGQTNQSFTPTSSGSYALAITQNSCTDTSACHTIIVSATANPQTASSYKLFPNPIKYPEKLMLQSDILFPPASHWILYNLQGTELISHHLPKGQNTHSLALPPNLSSGIYIWSIQTQYGLLAAGKIVVW